MKTIFYISIIIAFTLSVACVKETTYQQDKYICQPTVALNDNHPMKPNLINFMNEMIKRGSTGVSIMLKSTDGTWYGSKGMADLATGVKMQPCNKFRLGSLTKMVTAIAILRLYDEGKLKLDDPISKYIDQSIIKRIDNADKATILTLLNHNSYIRNYLDVTYILDAFNFSIENNSADKMLERIYDKDGPAEITYANTNYVLLGKIMEKIENKPVYDVIREKVIYPLGLSNTNFPDQEPTDLVQSYADVYDNGKYVNVNEVDKKLFGGKGFCDGALISNTEDLIKCFESISDSTFLKAETFNLMKDFVNIPKNPMNKYHKKFGLSLFYFDTPYGIAYGHPGGLYSFNSFMCYFPDKNMYFVCLSNCSSTANFMASDEVFDCLFKSK
jgi:D-alanyl-D-alanine carboxypeptidase